ncbi:hypothetical protein ONR75_13720 [Rhodopseudomonas sp. P2A-2r]|uniref:hypothetical protein n=1 Tax=Rhodopseudomonas sp. P2A-2r TaxID=2991972 RepID=UPI0022344D45|nr:hypothetical protein [Rhodopseudomonas sp. P2A-2r]UZE51556.1 hypothetical protein ONR75_13720 [Rhodopseudomonas sp. P2A-2r]
MTVDSKTYGLDTLRDAAKKAMCSQADIARFIVDGRLQCVATLKGNRDYGSILVDESEVRTLLYGVDATTLSLPDFAERGGFGRQAAQALVKYGHVESVSVVCSGHRTARISLSAATAFEERYVSLGKLSRERGEHFKTVWKALKEQGVRPAFDPVEVFARFYRRSDLQA